MKKNKILFLLAGLVISSCLSTTHNLNTPTQASTEINLPTPTNNGILTLNPQNHLSFVQACVDIQDKTQSSTSLEGTIVLNSKLLDPFGDTGEISFMNLENLEIMPIASSEEETIAIPSKSNISPDRKKFFYFSNDKQLFVKYFDEAESRNIFWDSSWGEALEWFDNERLLVRPKNTWQDGILIIINLLTGEWMQIQNKFPSGLNSFFPFVDYNLTLNRGIYASGDYLILWDIQSGYDIWKKISLSKKFQWNINRDKVAVVTNTGDLTQNKSNELVVINQEGQEILVTNFAEYYPLSQQIEIQNLNWSPDGKYLTFALKIDGEDTEIKTPTLIVIDIESMRIYDFCLVVHEYAPIIWSPDSKNIIITTPINYEEYIKTINLPVPQKGNAILLNLTNNYAVQIVSNTIVDGWFLTR